MLVVVMRVSPVVLSLALLACSPTPSVMPAPEPSEPPAVRTEVANEAIEPSEPAEPIDPQFTGTLLSAAQNYRKWGRVDERPNLAPVLCRAPMGLDHGFPSHARLSQADDAEHGKKLYYLFAGFAGLAGIEGSARERYSSLGSPGSEPGLPVGLTIVKQSWVAQPHSPPATESRPQANAKPVNANEVLEWTTDPPAPIAWVEHDGQRLDVGEQAELFVMAKVGAADMPGTDAGWIYGTLSADGLTVTSAGLVQRCMDCHDVAPHERLFGLQKTKAFATVKPTPWAEQGEIPRELGLEP